MMRSIAIPSIALTLALMATIPTVSAQEDGCTQAQPCPWVLDLDADGFVGDDVQYNGTVGDWVVLDVFNFDEAAHALSLEAYGFEWQVDGVDRLESEPFELVIDGTFSLRDEPSGDTAPLQVTEGDPLVEEEQTGAENTDTGADRRIPPPGLMLTTALVGAAVAVRRRLH